MAFDVAVWRKTRLGDAEGSGVAKAIAQFNKVWPKNSAALDEPTHKAAGEAIADFRLALDTAEGKCDKAKKPDPKKLSATKKLIGDWRKDLTAYDQWLAETFAAKQAQRVIDRVAESFNQVVPNSLQEIRDKIDGLDQALKQRDLNRGYKFQTDASKSLRVLADQLTPHGVSEQIGYAVRALRIDTAPPSVKSCTPNAFRGWKRDLADEDERFERLQEQMEELESGATDEDPDQAEGSPDYKRHLKEIISDYKSVTQVCVKTGKTLDLLMAQCKRLQAMPPEERAEKRQVFDKVVSKFSEENLRCEAEMKTEVEKIRNSEGAYIKKKQAYAITKPDENKFLAPILNQMFSKNLRAIKTIVTVRRAVAELQEGGG